MTKIKSYPKRDKYFEDHEVGNDTHCFDVCHQHEPATINLSKTCVLGTFLKYPEAVLVQLRTALRLLGFIPD